MVKVVAATPNGLGRLGDHAINLRVRTTKSIPRKSPGKDMPKPCAASSLTLQPPQYDPLAAVGHRVVHGGPIYILRAGSLRKSARVSTRWPIWRRCTIRRAWRRLRPRKPSCRVCRTWPSSTRPSMPPWRPRPTPTLCHTAGPATGVFAVSAFTASATPTAAGAPRRCLGDRRMSCDL